jgi:hypothetical protein
MHYRVNAPQVMAETIGEETIIVNLAAGHYFNLLGTGVEIWEGIAREEPLPTIIERLESRYEARDGEIRASVSRLIDDLKTEELIVAADGNGTDAPRPTATAHEDGRAAFAPPSLAKFTDMQDIILLDPVHEVDARGWPHAPSGA